MPDFARMLDEVQYSLLVMLAGIHWSVEKALLMAGYTVKLINQWLVANAFVPIITQTNDSLRVAVGVVFVVALLVLGITYLLAAFIRLEVVNPRSAILWYVAGALFFSVGPGLYQSLSDFRQQIGGLMYLSVLNGLSGSTGSTFASLAQINNNDLGLGAVCDQLDVYLPDATAAGALDGLDIALAYLRGHGQDVMGYPQPVYSPGCGAYLLNPNPATWATTGGTSVVPMDWNQPGGYFDDQQAPVQWDSFSDADRDVSLALAGASQRRLLTAWPLLLFGLAEQIVQLLITTALGMTFVSFGVAILFAFFKRTESIAHSLINQWIELIVQTVAIALVQALVVGFCLAGAATGSAAAVMGIGLIGLVFILITLWSGVKAVWNSFNRLFGAIGQVTGGVLLAPSQIVGGMATAAAGGTALAAGAGTSALAGLGALSSGATLAQTAGLMLGGQGALSGAARTLSHLHGLRGTALGEVAEQFSEGAATRAVGSAVPIVGSLGAPLVGASLLSDRDPDKAVYDRHGQVVSRPMLRPEVGDTLAGWTEPVRRTAPDRPLVARHRPAAPDSSNNGQRRIDATERVGEEREQPLTGLQTANSHPAARAVPAATEGQTAGPTALADRLAQPPETYPLSSNPPGLSRLLEQAQRTGLNASQTEQIIREVQTSPGGQLTASTREQLDRQVQITQSLSWLRARDEVTQLEQAARQLLTHPEPPSTGEASASLLGSTSLKGQPQ